MLNFVADIIMKLLQKTQLYTVLVVIDNQRVTNPINDSPFFFHPLSIEKKTQLFYMIENNGWQFVRENEWRWRPFWAISISGAAADIKLKSN